eukprot:g425.t1
MTVEDRHVVSVHAPVGSISNVNGHSLEHFKFSRVFDEHTSQAKMYSKTLRPIVDGIFDGQSAVMFAYGVSNSGKSFTIQGEGLTSSTIGLLPQAMIDIFERNGKLEVPLEVEFCCLEITDRKIRDLLAEEDAQNQGDCPDRFTGKYKKPSKRPVRIREDRASGRVFCDNVAQHKLGSVHEGLSMLKFARSSRTVGATRLNENSSRGHAMYTITVRKPRHRIGAQITVVDMAGVERPKKSKVTGNRLRETCRINSQLMHVTRVLRVLKWNQDHPGRQRVVPFRESKITQLLQPALSGLPNGRHGGPASRVLVLLTASPGPMDFDEKLASFKEVAGAQQLRIRRLPDEVGADIIEPAATEPHQASKPTTTVPAPAPEPAPVARRMGAGAKRATRYSQINIYTDGSASGSSKQPPTADMADIQQERTKLMRWLKQAIKWRHQAKEAVKSNAVVSADELSRLIKEGREMQALESTVKSRLWTLNAMELVAAHAPAAECQSLLKAGKEGKLLEKADHKVVRQLLSRAKGAPEEGAKTKANVDGVVAEQEQDGYETADDGSQEGGDDAERGEHERAQGEAGGGAQMSSTRMMLRELLNRKEREIEHLRSEHAKEMEMLLQQKERETQEQLALLRQAKEAEMQLALDAQENELKNRFFSLQQQMVSLRPADAVVDDTVKMKLNKIFNAADQLSVDCESSRVPAGGSDTPWRRFASTWRHKREEETLRRFFSKNDDGQQQQQQQHNAHRHHAAATNPLLYTC